MPFRKEHKQTSSLVAMRHRNGRLELNPRTMWQRQARTNPTQFNDMPHGKSATEFIAPEYHSNSMLYVYLSRLYLPGVPPE